MTPPYSRPFFFPSQPSPPPLLFYSSPLPLVVHFTTHLPSYQILSLLSFPSITLVTVGGNCVFNQCFESGFHVGPSCLLNKGPDQAGTNTISSRRAVVRFIQRLNSMHCNTLREHKMFQRFTASAYSYIRCFNCYMWMLHL